MQDRRSLKLTGYSRIVLISAALVYAVALHVGHRLYLYPVWGYYGFKYENPGVSAPLLVAVFVILGAATLPRQLGRPSSIVLVLLFGVVYVPTMTFTPYLDETRVWDYLPSLAALAAGFTLANLAGRMQRLQIAETRLPSVFLANFFLLLWTISAVSLVVLFGSVMHFARLDEVYGQRALGATANPAVAYLQAYFANVFSPALIALGLVMSRKWFAFLGIVGCIMAYMITAQRTVFFLPVVMFCLNYALTSRLSFLRNGTFAVLLLAFCVALSTAIASTPGAPATVSSYLQFRTLGLPGLTFSQYYDLFSREGFTYWSHVKGLNLLVPAPPALSSSPSWPGLGYVVGDWVYRNPENNHNANLFTSDGVAAAGPVGVVVISILFAAWLATIDTVAKQWDRRFALLAILPLGLSLTNGQFSTMLLSFGGLFWIMIFYFFSPTSRSADFLRPMEE